MDPSAISSPPFFFFFGNHSIRGPLITFAKSGKATFGLGNARIPNQPPHQKNNIALDRLPSCTLGCCLRHRLLRLRGQRLLDLTTRPCWQCRLSSVFHSISLCARLWTFSLCFSSGQNWSDDASNSDRSSSDVGQRTKELLEDPFLLVVGVKAATWIESDASQGLVKSRATSALIVDVLTTGKIDNSPLAIREITPKRQDFQQGSLCCTVLCCAVAGSIMPSGPQGACSGDKSPMPRRATMF